MSSLGICICTYFVLMRAELLSYYGVLGFFSKCFDIPQCILLSNVNVKYRDLCQV